MRNIMRKVNNRITRINEEIKQELSMIIGRELKDPRVEAMTTVVRVETTSDLKHCKVYISVLGSEKAEESTKEGLQCSKGFIRKELARRLNLRNTPELHFEYDHSIEYGIHMSELIEKVKKKDNQGE